MMVKPLHRVFLLSFACFLTVVHVFFGTTGDVPAQTKNKYKKVEQGIGNCIFASHELGKDKEATYTDVRTEFKAPEEVHVRCYFPKKIKEYESKGKIFNSLKDTKNWYTELSIDSLVEKTHGFQYGVRTGYADDTMNWETQRFDFVLEKDGCDFKYTGGECVSLEKDVKELMAADKKSPLYTADVCVEIFIEAADEAKTVWDEHDKAWKNERQLYRPLVASSCFKYTVK